MISMWQSWCIKFIVWIQGLFVKPYRVEIVDGSLPRILKKHKLYILKEDSELWQASMVCPCGCAEILEMNLLPDERPQWEFTMDEERRASLHPSVWRQIGCRSHFFLKKGKIIWV
ncbi:MAG: hypothetical protein EB059_03190 [Alphaproteobacteria bacterium]|nr:hypothetical protein [Alphaproteobacteria bacterium]